MTSSFRPQFALFALLFLGSLVAAQAQQQITGSYITQISGQPVAEEQYTVTINQDGSLRSEASAGVGPGKSRVVTVAAKDKPVSFFVAIGDKTVLSAGFDAGTATVTLGDQPARTVKTDASLVLENGAWHQFIYLFKQYDPARGGAQNFKAFLPSQAVEYSLQVERVDTPSFNVKGQQVATEHYRIVTGENLVIEIWTDPARVPLLMSVPSQSVKVIRGDARELAEIVLGKPPTANTDFTSEEVTFNNGAVKLAGTLTLPKKGQAPFPAAIIISGSGAQDRDGAIGVFNLYKLVAESLSNAGVAVLRADDRGVGKSIVPEPRKPGSYRDLINDSRAAFEYLAQRSDIDKTRIALVGHSEGSETALTIAADDPRVAAIILLAGCAHPVDRVALEQSIYQLALRETIDPGDQTKLHPAARAILKLFESAKSTPPPASGNDQYSWFRDHLASDPSALARRVKCPVLILNGERDALVLAHNAIDLAQVLTSSGNRQVRLRLFPNLTHVFTPAAIDKNAPPEKLTEVSPDVLQTLTTWATRVLLPKTP